VVKNKIYHYLDVGDTMKLRYILIITFCFIVTLPMALFWSWPYSKALELELQEVNEKHLVIAKNLSAVFERYYDDVIGLFSIIETQSPSQLASPEFKKLLQSYNFRQIVTIDNNGNVDSCLFSTEQNCIKKVDDHILQLAKNTLVATEIKLSTVTEDQNVDKEAMFLVVKKLNNLILLGYLSTEYIVDMGQRVAFGEKGHAAIVDQAGNVLAHPLPSWIKARKNIVEISAVQKMLAGKTGMEYFYSPALKGDMIAGYTHVPGANWGVMVPQPVKELEVKAEEVDRTVILVMLIGVGLAFLIAIPVSFILISPLENLLKTIKRIEKEGSKATLELNMSRMVPLELRELNKSFAGMMTNIKSTKKEILKLAYFDSTSGLPNRNHFQELSIKALVNMSQKGQQAALIFIDFDGFKLVNDTYGHRVGDELLHLFGKRLADFLSFDTNDLDNELCSHISSAQIPARLGGDEFVILFQNIKDTKELELHIRALFEQLFAEYTLYDDVSILLTGSAGVAIFPDNGRSYDQLMRSADLAMYAAKQAGKNCIEFSNHISHSEKISPNKPI